MYTSGNFQRLWSGKEDYYEKMYYNRTKDKTFIFTDRGLYKPGEVVNIKGIRRIFHKDKWKTSSGDTLQIKIRNSRGEDILTRKVVLNSYGTFIAACSLSAEAPTGAYSIEMSSKYEYDRDYFRVEEFKPAEFTIDITSDRKHVYYGDKPVVNISGKYMYGSSMSGDTVKWRAYLNHTYYKPKGYEQYSFAGEYYYGMAGVANGTGIMDETGTLRLETGKLSGNGILDDPHPRGTRRRHDEAPVSGS